MSDKEEKVQQFKSVTGVEEERARFYLESSRWDLEIAIASFYENDEPEVVVNEPQRSEAVNLPSTETSSSPQFMKSSAKSKTRNPKFATIHTINSSSEEEEEGQAFYAGGSEHSGQQVLGPAKKKDIVSDMFKAVREHGVELSEPSAGSSSNAHAFKGTGYKLGQTETDTEAVPGAQVSKPPEQVTLKLWADGFSVDDGELRHYADPSNRDFLDSIRRGEIPHELRLESSEVHLAMEDHRMEAYKKDLSGSKRKPFSGHGYTLGSPAPAAVGAPAIDEKDCKVNEANAKILVSVDPSKPTTNLQIRLADGTRLVAQFNHDHTVADIRTYITTARPQYQTRSFILLSTYPSRELKDEETLASAGLLNSSIMQKLT
ncbi:NSFL1 cofactor p47 [Agrilus planipennis]|uniref:NSFL1 cofactor p47 n=1 Tax=Agrilus planipennis TaxID=224129 RepID=A0A1W4WTH1_AGRPL|nr:NSFL1 cofactor p47 [Agrilus planipennis]